jgi:hypothetical protein
LKERNVAHRKVTPIWPEANGEVENFMRNIKKVMQTVQIDGLQWHEHMTAFLKNNRATPHSTTKIAPATLMFGRNIRTRMPEVKSESSSGQYQLAARNDMKNKSKMKAYADAKRHTKASDLKVGETVLVKQKKPNKYASNFDPKPYRVIVRKGPLVSAARKGKIITRNISHFTRVNMKTPMSSEEMGDLFRIKRDEPVVSAAPIAPREPAAAQEPAPAIAAALPMAIEPKADGEPEHVGAAAIMPVEEDSEKEREAQNFGDEKSNGSGGSAVRAEEDSENTVGNGGLKEPTLSSSGLSSSVNEHANQTMFERALDDDHKNRDYTEVIL